VKSEFEYLLLARERFTLELLSDVHASHGVRNAIIVVADGLQFLRIALANAWVAGVRRFILLFAGREEPTPAQTYPIEQELRVLLDTLGDGGAAPAVYAALTRCAGGTKHMKPAMLRLLDEIERVFPPEDEAIIATPLPASFAREAAILDAIAPLVRGGTMIDYVACTLEESAELGSHVNGWPYLPLDEAWPRCRRCKRELPCYQQFDMREALHATARHLYVIYRCDNCYSPDNVVVRHYETMAAPRRPIDPAAPSHGDPMRVVMERAAHMLPDSDLLEPLFPEAVAKLRAIDENWGRIYWDTEGALGMGSLRIPDHLGGWHTAQTPTVPTCACDTPLHLVSSTQWGDWWNTIWACPLHADLTANLFHK
jgi:hypothetical protein